MEMRVVTRKTFIEIQDEELGELRMSRRATSQPPRVTAQGEEPPSPPSRTRADGVRLAGQVTGGRPDDKCQLDSVSDTGNCAASRPALDKSRFVSVSSMGSYARSKPRDCKFNSASSMGSYASSQPVRGKGKFNSKSSMESCTTDGTTPRTMDRIESKTSGSTNFSSSALLFHREAQAIQGDLLASSPPTCEEVSGIANSPVCEEESSPSSGSGGPQEERQIGWGVPVPFPPRRRWKKRPPVADDRRTTVSIRGLPTGCTRQVLKELLDGEGLCGWYNFLYAPVDFETGATLGLGFVNLVRPSLAADFWQRFDGCCLEVNGCRGTCSVEWSESHQGLRSHVDRYRNSSLMHPDVPDERRPATYFNGMRVVFPSPTKEIHAVAQRSRRHRARHEEKSGRVNSRDAS